jgi:hypothetical protein
MNLNENTTSAKWPSLSNLNPINPFNSKSLSNIVIPLFNIWDTNLGKIFFNIQTDRHLIVNHHLDQRKLNLIKKLRHGRGNRRSVSPSYLPINTPTIKSFLTTRFQYIIMSYLFTSCHLLHMPNAHAVHDFQTYACDSISCRNFIFLHPVFVICSVTFEVISCQQDFRWV